MDELSLTIFDIVENSIRAKAKNIVVLVEENKKNNYLEIIIEDDGIGMTNEEISKALDPFYTTKTVRKIGLGLSLFKMITEQTDGTFNISSKINIGTKIKARLTLNHIDRPKLGELSEMIYSILINDEVEEFKYIHITDSDRFEISKKELFIEREMLMIGEIAKSLKEYIDFNLNKLGRGE
ncbi:ATP-binding protein [Acholeplasma sp. OttesenSCG-928-E16]|nr:ATP-binding protein [Acholeplasma sp. OttesenSCG-928-E16]